MQIRVTEDNIRVNGKDYNKPFFELVTNALNQKGIEYKYNGNAVSKRHYPMIAKAYDIIEKYGLYAQDHIAIRDFDIVTNRNLRYGKAKSRKAFKIGQINDHKKGFPLKIIWLLIDNELYKEGLNNNGFDTKS